MTDSTKKPGPVIIKRPKATFGDVRKGTPQSRGDEREDRPRRGDRKESSHRAELLADAPPPLGPDAGPAPEEESFAAMYAESESSRPQKRALRVGQKVTGKVFSIGGDVAFLTLGGKSEAMLDLAEVRSPDGSLYIHVGDDVEVFVVSTGAEGVRVSKGQGKAGGAGAAAMLADARRAGLPVEGLVTGVNKGGLEVTVAGARAFCPVSQIDTAFVEDPARFIGQKLLFKITEMKGKDIVLSRKALMAEESARKAVETRKTLEVGARLKGTVVSMRDFGAFVDLGGVQGMIPVSELAWTRIGKPSDVLAQGQEIEVEVLRIEPGDGKKERITLSLKSLAARPEPQAAAAPGEPRETKPTGPGPQVGQVVEATVEKAEPYGVFVNWDKGKGLIPASETGTPRGSDLRKQFPAGRILKAAIIEIDDRGRLRLSVTAAEHAEERAEMEAYKKERPQPTGKGFGTFADLLGAKLKK